MTVSSPWWEWIPSDEDDDSPDPEADGDAAEPEDASDWWDASYDNWREARQWPEG